MSSVYTYVFFNNSAFSPVSTDTMLMLYPQPICLLSPTHIIVSEAEVSGARKLEVEVDSSSSTSFRKIPNP